MGKKADSRYAAQKESHHFRKYLRLGPRVVDETIGGNKIMSKDKFTFADVEEAKNKYADEAKARWGNTDRI